MNAQVRCHCQSCTIRSLTGPAMVITIGVLFLLDRLHGGHFYFGNTWPVLLLVIGLLHLGSSLAPREGHVESGPPPMMQTPPGVPPSNPPQAPTSGQGQ